MYLLDKISWDYLFYLILKQNLMDFKNSVFFTLCVPRVWFSTFFGQTWSPRLNQKPQVRVWKDESQAMSVYRTNIGGNVPKKYFTIICVSFGSVWQTLKSPDYTYYLILKLNLNQKIYRESEFFTVSVPRVSFLDKEVQVLT